MASYSSWLSKRSRDFVANRFTLTQGFASTFPRSSAHWNIMFRTVRSRFARPYLWAYASIVCTTCPCFTWSGRKSAKTSFNVSAVDLYLMRKFGL